MDVVRELVEDELRAVPYAYLAKRCKVDVDEAKRCAEAEDGCGGMAGTGTDADGRGERLHVTCSLLREYADEEGEEKCDAVYAVSGWKTDGSDQDVRHTVSLCRREQLKDVEAQLQAVLGVHVYGVHANMPKDPSDFWAIEYMQAESDLKRAGPAATLPSRKSEPISDFFDEDEEPSHRNTARKAPTNPRPPTEPPGALGAMWDRKKAEELKGEGGRTTDDTQKPSATKTDSHGDEHGKPLGVTGVQKTTGKKGQKGIMAFFGKE